LTQQQRNDENLGEMLQCGIYPDISVQPVIDAPVVGPQHQNRGHNGVVFDIPKIGILGKAA
jgi:hypothetical protein